MRIGSICGSTSVSWSPEWSATSARGLSGWRSIITTPMTPTSICSFAESARMAGCSRSSATTSSTASANSVKNSSSESLGRGWSARFCSRGNGSGSRALNGSGNADGGAAALSDCGGGQRPALAHQGGSDARVGDRLYRGQLDRDPARRAPLWLRRRAGAADDGAAVVWAALSAVAVDRVVVALAQRARGRGAVGGVYAPGGLPNVRDYGAGRGGGRSGTAGLVRCGVRPSRLGALGRNVRHS